MNTIEVELLALIEELTKLAEFLLANSVTEQKPTHEMNSTLIALRSKTALLKAKAPK